MTAASKLVARVKGGKWEQPGWRIEQRYSQGVLIGNWSEERLGKVRPRAAHLYCNIYTHLIHPSVH